MFENLRRAFREAVENFHEELNRDQVSDAVDRLLSGMKKELVRATSELHRLESEITRSLEAAEAEAGRAATCRRRETLARGIGDEETARLAHEYGERHEERQRVFEEKARALRAEAEIRRTDLARMTEAIDTAVTRKSSLAAQAGRVDAREVLDELDPLFGEMDRMADRVADDAAAAEAARIVDQELSGEPGPVGEAAGGGTSTGTEPREDLDGRLAELKRRMRGG